MRWIKASERLPDKAGLYKVKRRYSLPSDKEEVETFTGTGFMNYHGYAVLEWLDESTPEGVTAAKDYEKEYVFAKLELAEAHKEIARLKEDVKELVECLDLIVGSMSLERVERFELNEKAKSLIQKHEQ